MSAVIKRTCPICCENVFSYKTISCSKCEFEVCHKCIVEYTKTLKVTEIACMNTDCKHIWDRSFICRSLPTSIVYGPLKNHREDMLLEREIATLPETSQLIPMMNDSKILSLEMEDIRVQITKLKNLLGEKEDLYYPLQQKIKTFKAELEGETVAESKDEAKQVDQIMCPCPAKDCRGFVFKNTSCCTICQVEICSKCHVIVEDKHECKEADIASVALIKKDCKSCPGCGVPSRKTDGCSQVWCIMCHKAWDWNTGKIDYGYVHATDYYNYIRAKGLEIPQRDVGGECGDPTFRITYMSRNHPSIFTNQEQTFLFRRLQLSLEYTGIHNRPPANIALVDLRLKYLNKEIDKIKWKRMLHKRDKEFALTTEIYRLKQAYGRTINDCIMNLCANYNKKVSLCILQENLNGIHKVHEMMIEEYDTIAHAFKSKRTCPFTQ